MSNSVNYKPKFGPGDVIVVNHQFKTILDFDDGQYKIKFGDGGRVKWVDASDVDHKAKLHDRAG